MRNPCINDLPRKTGFDNDALVNTIVDKHSTFEYLVLSYFFANSVATCKDIEKPDIYRQ
jgi:hypothetical protein